MTRRRRPMPAGLTVSRPHPQGSRSVSIGDHRIGFIDGRAREYTAWCSCCRSNPTIRSEAYSLREAAEALSEHHGIEHR